MRRHVQGRISDTVREGSGSEGDGVCWLLPWRTLIVSKAGERPPGGPRVHEQSLLPHSCGEG